MPDWMVAVWPRTPGFTRAARLERGKSELLKSSVPDNVREGGFGSP
jgi:hypothetical protein